MFVILYRTNRLTAARATYKSHRSPHGHLENFHQPLTTVIFKKTLRASSSLCTFVIPPSSSRVKKKAVWTRVVVHTAWRRRKRDRDRPGRGIGLPMSARRRLFIMP